MFKIENEFDLHSKVIQYMRRFYPDAIIIAGLGQKPRYTRKENSFMEKKGLPKRAA